MCTGDVLDPANAGMGIPSASGCLPRSADPSPDAYLDDEGTSPAAPDACPAAPNACPADPDDCPPYPDACPSDPDACSADADACPPVAAGTAS